MPKRRNPRAKGAEGDAHARHCFFCRISEEMNQHFEAHSGSLRHLENAKREVLEAVREFVDKELEYLERSLRSRNRKKGKRVTRVEVQ